MSLSIEDMCRTCMFDGSIKNEFALRKAKDKQMVSLSTVPEDLQGDISLMDILRATVPQLKMEQNNQLPTIVCLECTNKLMDIYQFQQNCLTAERKFRELLVPVKTDNEQSLLDIVNSDMDNSGKIMKAELEDVDETPFPSDQYIAKDNASVDRLNINDDNFMKNGSDLSTDFELNDKSESHYEVSKKTKVRSQTSSSSPRKKANIPNHKEHPKEFYSCTRCKKNLKSEKSLRKHLELHEKFAGEQDRKCSYCDKEFEHAYRLKDHLRSHSGEKPFLCSECGKGFATSSSLNQHIFRHKGERQFVCPDCPKAFNTRNGLLTHSIGHKTEARIHVCDICGRGFTRAFVLKQHKMYHSNERAFSCEHCDKRFFTNEKLKRHTRIHTGDKPYKCKFCEKAYSQSNDLTKHLRSHIGDNVYQCTLCPQRFPTVKLTKEHFVLHKNDDEETRADNLAELNAMEIKGIFVDK